MPLYHLQIKFIAQFVQRKVRKSDLFFLFHRLNNLLQFKFVFFFNHLIQLAFRLPFGLFDNFVAFVLLGINALAKII